MKFNLSKLACVILTLAWSQAQLSAAPTLTLDDKGITVDSGGLKGSLAFPVPVNAAKAKGKIAEKTVSGTGAVLKYEGGGQVDLQVTEGKLVLKSTGLPDDTAFLLLSMKLDSAAMENGKWSAGPKSGIFPSATVTGQIYQGTTTNFSVNLPSGPGITFTVPASFQQLMDLRQFQTKQFFWQCWITYKAGTDTTEVAITESTGGEVAASSAPSPATTTSAPTTATSTTAAAPATPPATGADAPKAPENERQKWGQLNGFNIPDQKTGTRVLKWKDGKKAAFLLSFDDSSPTHINIVIPELEKRKMVGNFYVNPGSNWWKSQETKWPEVAKSPYVLICNHTFLHNGTQTVQTFEEDIQKTNAAILAITPQLNKDRIIVFRQPGGVPWKITKEETKTLLDKYHMLSRPWLDGPPLTMKTLPPVLATVDRALEKGDTGFVDFHGVGGDANVAPTEWFTALLDKLEEHRSEIWIADTLSWFQYQYERKDATLKVVSTDASQVKVSLTSTLAPVYYNLPLTIAVQVPTEWKACTITQGAKTSQATAADGEVRFDATPGADEIVIKGA